MTQQDPKLGSMERFFEAYAAHDPEGIAAVVAEDIT
jgi:hypothetical protein